ncbi:hypothetical protein BG004_002571 [Podila humilis]|nr:hypothetical protein BG004_002571 [Podila humilis]
MSTQSMMVPPNNAPWPGMSPAPSSSAPTSTSTSSTSPSAYPPPPYYHHPAHPPHHPGHPPSPHQAPYYPYHPYSASGYPPYPPPSHVHPAYHHPPYSAQPSSTHPSTPASTTSSSYSTENSTNSSKPTATSKKSAKSGQSEVSEIENANARKSGNDVGEPGAPATANGPKTFRFEGSISSETYKTTKSFDLAGVNILNRKPLDTRTALDKLQRRRETHNRVERKRRDCINQLVDDLTKLLPPKHLEEATSKCHRVNVLRGAVAHIKFLTESNDSLAKSLDIIKQGHPELEEILAAATKAAEPKSNVDGDIQPNADGSEMAMEIDTVEEENVDELDESESAAPILRLSPSESPRSTPSRDQQAKPHVIVTSASGPTLEKDSPRSSKSTPVPPISIITTPAEVHGQENEQHHNRGGSISECVSPASSFSHSPLFPPSQYTSSSPKQSSVSAFPPSPVSPSPSHHNPFSHADGGRDGSSKEQLSPFMHRPSAHSPSLPPISSLANLQIQSPPSHPDSTAGDRRPEERSLSPSSRPAAAREASKGPGHRSTSTLPPLMLPSEQHLHPSYAKGSEKNNKQHQQQQQQQQPPVSSYMLSPSVPRSPAASPSTGAPPSPYPPHWGHEGREGNHPPPPPPPHYMPPHGYPHGYPYPYPYHPSYGYPPHHPHPHPPPPPPHHHHHHQAPPPPAPAQGQPASAIGLNRHLSLQPEPIFIQEEPWVVQRKRSTSTANGKAGSGATSKTGSSSQQAKKSKSSSSSTTTTTTSTSNTKEDETPVEDGAVVPGSPSSSSVTSRSPSMSSNMRKRPSSSQHTGGGTASSLEMTSKRSKQQDKGNSGGVEDDANESMVEADQDAAQALTSLARNS